MLSRFQIHWLLRALLAQRSTSKNRAIPYRIVVNEGKPDYEGSKNTSRPFVRRQGSLPPRPVLASNRRPSSRFKSRVLNPIHLNQVKDKEPTNKEVKGDEARLKENSGEKHQMKKENEYRHDRSYHHGPHMAQQQLQQQPPHRRDREHGSIADGKKQPARSPSMVSASHEISSAGAVDMVSVDQSRLCLYTN